MTTKSTPSAGNAARSRTAPIDDNLRVGLAKLRHAYSCAQDAGSDLWDFALEIDTLYETGLTISDLRWLVAKRFADHGQESSVYGGPHRSFRPGAGYFFEPTTCVVLTSSGAAFADHYLKTLAASPQPTLPIETASLAGGQTAELENEPPAAHHLNGSTTAACKPCWNSMRRELCLNDMVVKRFRVPAQIQQLILGAFEEEGWPGHIDDPLPGSGDIDPHTRLHDAIHRLNGHQAHRLLRFRGNGNGTGVAWELRRPVALRRTSISGTAHK
ncbi:MAG: hypothetical protein ACLQIB_52790 [Isosphaeraceae bacterium]